MRRGSAVLLCIAVTTLIALGGTTGYATTSTQSPQLTQVSIINGAHNPPACYTNSTSCGVNYLYGFSPQVVTVVIGVNNTVVWTNDDTGQGAIHTVTSSSGDPASFGSSCLGSQCSPPGPDSYNYTFTVAGTYYYHCQYHGWMEGEVIVEAPSTTTTSSHSSSASSSSKTSSSSSIPEFPYQPLGLIALTTGVVLAYMALRRPTLASRKP